MDDTLKEAVSVVITYAVVGAVGFRQARRIRKHLRTQTWVLLVVGVGSVGYLLTNARLITIFGFTVYVSWVLQAFMLGLLIGVVFREFRKGFQTRTH
jgi:hypothetical protein